MIGNGILAFAVIVVVVIFVYMSLKVKNDKEKETTYAEVYNIELTSGFIGDSVSVYLNDSLLLNQLIRSDTIKLSAQRFAEQSALLIVDNKTERISTFNLKEEGDNVFFRKEDGVILMGSK
mgnify:CR=1 FL=1